METFIREYMLPDPSVCDALVELHKKAVAAGGASRPCAPPPWSSRASRARPPSSPAPSPMCTAASSRPPST